MSSPVQVGDVIAILREIYKAYDAWKTIPTKLRKALKRFEEAENEIQSLNKILSNSRRREYRSYPDTSQLHTDLINARDYFQRFQPLTDEAGQVRMVARVKTFFTARWNENIVDDHVATINSHREMIDKLRQTVLIQSALDNTELLLHSITLQHNGGQVQRTVPVDERIVQDNASSVSSDRLSIVTGASKSLRLARRLDTGPAFRSRLALSPVIEASSASTGNEVDNKDVRFQIANYVERTGLYTRDKWNDDQIADLQHISRLPAQYFRAQRLRPVELDDTMLSSSEVSKYPSTSPTSITYGSLPIKHQTQSSPGAAQVSTSASPKTPTNLAVSPLEYYALPQHQHMHTATDSFSADSFSLSPSWKRAFNHLQHADDDEMKSVYTDVPVLPFPALSLVDDPVALHLDDLSDTLSTITDGLDPVENRLALADPVLIINPYTGNAGVKCYLKIVKSAGSLCIQSTSVKNYPCNSMPALSGESYKSPSSILPMSPGIVDIIQSRDTMPLVFNHAVLGGLGSYPRILHPSAEIGVTNEETYPYKISFYGHQYVQVEGYNTLPKAVTLLTYHFRSKPDRDKVREQIFGKKLLASAGISNIQLVKKDLMKPCGIQEVSLWLNNSSNSIGNDETETGKRGLTITVHCSSRGKTTEPDCVVELTGLNAKNADKVRNKQNKELELQVRPTLATKSDEGSVAVGSPGTAVLSSNASTASGSSERCLLLSKLRLYFLGRGHRR